MILVQVASIYVSIYDCNIWLLREREHGLLLIFKKANLIYECLSSCSTFFRYVCVPIHAQIRLSNQYDTA